MESGLKTLKEKQKVVILNCTELYLNKLYEVETRDFIMTRVL